MNFNKSYLKSKTLYVSLIVALLPLFPEVQDQIKDNPEYIGMIVGTIFGFLRVVTKGKIVLKEEE